MNNNSKIVIAALGGAVIGAGLALLFAPASGKETREKIAKKAEEAKDAVADSIKSLGNKANDALEKGKEAVKNKTA
ncbi:MAG TPA: YtxH domain-containing protein [Brumimicrobium sp.]|nr:YtxH domain-containing protein [Brumimicrobium sp.]